MKIPFKTVTIQNRLFISYSLVIALTLGLGVTAVYQLSVRIIEKQVGLSRLEAIRQLSINLGNLFTEIEAVSNLYYFDEELVDIVKQPIPESLYQKQLEENKVSSKIAQFKYSFEAQSIQYDVILCSFSGKEMTSWVKEWYNFKSILKSPWIKDVYQKNGQVLWVGTYNDKAGYGSDSFVFTAARLMKNLYNDKPIGLLILNVEENVLSRYYEKAQGIGNTIYIVDNHGVIISHTDKTLLDKKMILPAQFMKAIDNDKQNNLILRKNGHQILVTFCKLPRTNWIIVEEIPLAKLLAPISAMAFLTVVIFLACISMAFVIAYWVAQRISLPIKSLFKLTKEIAKGNLMVSATVQTEDEIGELSRGFNRMVITINQLLEGIRQEEKLKRLAELDFLKAQINPHFLYNTLNSIKCSISLNDKDTAEEMMLSFIRLLKKIFHHENEFVTVREEIDMIKDYIQIMSFRYGDKFDVVYRIPEEVQNLKILKMTLQPIIENSIFHGIEPKKGRGCITVEAKVENDQLQLVITDDGVGMTSEQAASVLFQDKAELERTFNKVGIKNVHERITLYFGNHYGVKIFSSIGIGTTVEVRMPLQQ